eukprot:1838800-Pyramimonas_sp.AAC.3
MKAAQQAAVRVTVHIPREAGASPALQAFTAAKPIAEELLGEEQAGSVGAGSGGSGAGAKPKKAGSGTTSSVKSTTKSASSSKKSAAPAKGGSKRAAPRAGLFTAGQSLGSAHKGMMDMSDMYKGLE